LAQTCLIESIEERDAPSHPPSSRHKRCAGSRWGDLWASQLFTGLHAGDPLGEGEARYLAAAARQR